MDMPLLLQYALSLSLLMAVLLGLGVLKSRLLRLSARLSEKGR